MVGELPSDFLRTGPALTQEQEDERIARALQAQQQAGHVMSSSNFAGRLSISVVQVLSVDRFRNYLSLEVYSFHHTIIL